jgi:hypothetical protein
MLDASAKNSMTVYAEHGLFDAKTSAVGDDEPDDHSKRIDVIQMRGFGARVYMVACVQARVVRGGILATNRTNRNEWPRMTGDCSRYLSCQFVSIRAIRGEDPTGSKPRLNQGDNSPVHTMAFDSSGDAGRAVS